MEHTKHIIRAVLLLAVIAVLFVLVRHFVYPRSFGVYGAYRYDSVAEHTVPSPVHGARGACADCHDEEADSHAGGKHASVSCEACHGPLSFHVRGDEHVAPMPVQRSNKLCGTCHQYLVSRPKEFPQVVLTDHVSEKGGDMSEAVCLECHDAHNPSE